MGKKKPNTPRSRVKAALRQVWLRSRERAAALKRESNTCQCCKRKASKAKGKEFKVEVHHLDGILNWDKILTLIYDQLLCDPSHLEVLCKECHLEKHEKEKEIKAPAPYTVTQGFDTAWFWIPNDMLANFYTDCDHLDGKMYMDAAAQFDLFDCTYGDYRTGGSPDCVPTAYDREI